MKLISRYLASNRWLLPAVIALTITLYWFYQVFKSPVADGFDGYYYVMQIDQLIKTGSMHSKDFSLIYLPIFILSQFTTPLFSYNITVSLIGIFFTFAAYKLIKKKDDLYSGLFVIIFILASPSVLFFLLQFPKNMLGCSLFLLLISSHRNKKTIQTVLIFLLVIFAHRLALVLTLAFLCLEFIVKKTDKRIIILVVAILLIAFTIPGLINIFDYKRIITDDLALFQYWGQISFLNLWDLWDNPAWVCDFIGIHLLILWALIHIKKDPLLLIVVSFLLLPILTYNSGSLSYRLFLNGYLLLPIISFDYIDRLRVKKILSSFLFISLIMTIFPRYDHSKFNPPVALYKNISTKLADELKKDQVDIIIAHKGIKEQIILNTDYEASNWAEEEISDATYRIFTNIDDYLLLLYLESSEISDIIALPGGYFLTRETLFTKLIHKIEENEPSEIFRSIDTWQNPLHLKPSFL